MLRFEKTRVPSVKWASEPVFTPGQRMDKGPVVPRNLNSLERWLQYFAPARFC